MCLRIGTGNILSWSRPVGSCHNLGTFVDAIFSVDSSGNFEVLHRGMRLRGRPLMIWEALLQEKNLKGPSPEENIKPPLWGIFLKIFASKKKIQALFWLGMIRIKKSKPPLEKKFRKPPWVKKKLIPCRGRKFSEKASQRNLKKKAFPRKTNSYLFFSPPWS